MGDLFAKYDSDIVWRLSFAKPGDVGLDLPTRIAGSVVKPEEFSHLVKPRGDESDEVPWLEVPPGGYAEVETGVRVKVPDEAWGLITGRSSTAWRRRLLVVQGIIDSGYVGYLRNLVFNPNPVTKRIHEGDRLAQLIIIPKYNVERIIAVEELPQTERAQSGFGSTGE